MVKIEAKQNCCGCEACVQACPKHCISFNVDAEGFSYPWANSKDCIDCGLCERVCPVINKSHERKPTHTYAAKNTNEFERLHSSSGGIFVMLAKKTIEAGGVVFGARFDKNWDVIHSYTETIDGINPFMGSKYVQSRIGDSYINAEKFLKEGRQVLFTGTPCHIAGLRRFLKKEYDNLITVDVICHGVPSPGVWQQYLEEIKQSARQGENSVSFPLNPSISECDTLAKSEDVSIKSISFRDKRLGWKKYSFALTLAKASADGKQNTVSLSQIHNKDPYFLGFNDYSLYLRPSCYSCPTRDLSSGSDLTIADFWGIDSLRSEMDDDKGVSAVLTNTEKGEVILSTLNLNQVEVDYNDLIVRNRAIIRNFSPPPSTFLDRIRYRAKFATKRDYFFFDKKRNVSRKVRVLCQPTYYKRIRSLILKLYRRIIVFEK